MCIDYKRLKYHKTIDYLSENIKIIISIQQQVKLNITVI